MKLVFGLLHRSFCGSVALFKVASHYLPDTMVWASAAAICRNNTFNEKMLGSSLVEGFICVRLIERLDNSWCFALASSEKMVVVQRALKPIVQPEVQVAQLSSEHGEGEDKLG